MKNFGSSRSVLNLHPFGWQKCSRPSIKIVLSYCRQDSSFNDDIITDKRTTIPIFGRKSLENCALTSETTR